jgi:hypothetical protein
MALVWWINHRTNDTMRARESAGCVLAAPAVVEVRGGALRDLNHRSEAEIAMGGYDSTGWPATFEAHQKSFRLRFGGPIRKRLGHDIGGRWDAVESAEVLALSRRRSVLFLTTHQGQRWRMSLYTEPTHLRDALGRLGVSAVSVHPTDHFKVGDAVRLRTGQTGTVVGTAPRDGDPGHIEVFIRMPDGAVDSWDSEALDPLAAPNTSR